MIIITYRQLLQLEKGIIMKDIIRTQIRLDASDYKMLKKLSYLKDVSINSLMAQGVKEFVEKDKKLLQNADIVVT